MPVYARDEVRPEGYSLSKPSVVDLGWRMLRQALDGGCDGFKGGDDARGCGLLD